MDDSGNPIADATVELHDDDDFRSQRAIVSSAEDGTFFIKYRTRCPYTTCGYLKVDAPGYEAIQYEIRKIGGTHFKSDLEVRLPFYDDLPEGQTAISDERPRPLVEQTKRIDYRANSSNATRIDLDEGSYCDTQVYDHGRFDEYNCVTPMVDDLGSCFLINDTRTDATTDNLICKPDGPTSEVAFMIYVPDNSLPTMLPSNEKLSPSGEYPPFEVRFPTSRANPSKRVTCSEVTQDIVTNTGERIGYACDDQPKTYLLADFEKAQTWKAVRIGTRSIQDGVLMELSRRTVSLLEIIH